MGLGVVARYGKAVYELGSNLNIKVRGVIALGLTAAAFIGGWRFGLAWGLVAALALLLCVAVATGIRLQGRLEAADTDFVRQLAAVIEVGRSLKREPVDSDEALTDWRQRFQTWATDTSHWLEGVSLAYAITFNDTSNMMAVDVIGSYNRMHSGLQHHLDRYLQNLSRLAEVAVHR